MPTGLPGSPIQVSARIRALPPPPQGANPQTYAIWGGPRGHRPAIHRDIDTRPDTHVYSGTGSGLAAWIQALPYGARARIPPGSYTIPGVIHLTNKQSITLRMSGVKIRPQNRQARVFMLWRCEMIMFDGGTNWFEIEGMHGTPHYQNQLEDPDNPLSGGYHINHGFDIQGCSGVVVRRCAINNIWGDFFRTGRYGTQHRNGWSRHIIFDDVECYGSGRQGFSNVAAEYVVFNNFKMGEIARSTLNIEPGGANDGMEYLAYLNGELGLSHLNSYFPANPWSNPEDVAGNHVYVENLHCTSSFLRGEHNKSDHNRWFEDWEFRNVSWDTSGQRSNSHLGMFNSRRFRRLILANFTGTFTNVGGSPNQMAVMRVAGLDGLTIEGSMNIANKRCDVIVHDPGVSPMNALPVSPAATRFYTGPGNWTGML